MAFCARLTHASLESAQLLALHLVCHFFALHSFYMLACTLSVFQGAGPPLLQLWFCCALYAFVPELSQ
jgi:hypothetical protein